MAMPVEVPGAAVHLVPGPEGVVAEIDLLLPDLKTEVILDPDESVHAELVLGDPLVVAPDEEGLNIQPGQNPRRVFGPTEGDVAQVIDAVAFPDSLVPPLDHRLVHLVER